LSNKSGTTATSGVCVCATQQHHATMPRTVTIIYNLSNNLH